MEKKFIAGQMYELTQLLATALQLDIKHGDVVRKYIVKRLAILEKEYADVSPSVRRSSRGETKKER